MTNRLNLTGPGHPAWKGGRFIHCGYVMVKRPDHPRANHMGYVQEHPLIAEKALGRFLEERHPIHHVDENKANNANTNLVICESDGYHKILHIRMKIMAAGGDPNTETICCRCHQVKRLTEFYRSKLSLRTGRLNYCIPCALALSKNRTPEQRTRDNARRRQRNAERRALDVATLMAEGVKMEAARVEPHG